MSESFGQRDPGPIVSRNEARLRLASAAALFGAGLLALASGAALWMSEGARIFVEAAFSAVLACL